MGGDSPKPYYLCEGNDLEPRLHSIATNAQPGDSNRQPVSQMQEILLAQQAESQTRCDRDGVTRSAVDAGNQGISRVESRLEIILSFVEGLVAEVIQGEVEINPAPELFGQAEIQDGQSRGAY